MATPCSTRNPLFLGRWFQDEVIIVAVCWYLTYPLRYRQVCDLLRDRGVSVAASTVMRWVLRYAPEFEKRWQGYEKPVGLSWRVDETYLKVGGRSRSARLQHHPVFRSSTRSPRGTEGAAIRRDPTSAEERLLSPKQGYHPNRAPGSAGGHFGENGPSMNAQ